MPTMQDHRFRAERNERFAEVIATLPERFPEWEVTALFYSALHYVEAFLATQGLHSNNHRDRNSLVTNLTNIGGEYHYLFRQSLDARYRLVPFTSNEVDTIKAGDFRRVKEEMLSQLGL